MHTSNNSIIGMYHSNTGEITNIYYISIITFIISMNRKISKINKITIMIIIINYSKCLFCFVMNNNTGSTIIITLINTTIAIVILM